MICALAILFIPDRITGGLKQYSDKELAAISDRYKNVKWQFWLWAIANIPILFIGTVGIFALQSLQPKFVVSGVLLLIALINSYNSVFALFTGVYPIDRYGHSWVYTDRGSITRLALRGIGVTLLIVLAGGTAAWLASSLLH